MIFLQKISIVFTGGGTAGHVTPNLALIPIVKEKLKDFELDVHYIGSENGIEKEIIQKYPDITYHSVRTGKLRRYFSLKNFTDPFRVIGGYFDAKKIMKKIKPSIVFSKGGFVSFPVAAAANAYKVPVISHESDLTPGLANKLSSRYAKKICTTFPDTLSHLPEGKGIHTGSPIRPELFDGDAKRARERYSFDNKPVILSMGGSLGSVILNKALRENLSELTKKYNVIHLCGKGNLDESCEKYSNSYKQLEFISEELPDALALADFVISRAGSNAIHEFLALHKPMLLVPLSKAASRGDQILNAESFKKRGFAIVLEEENITKESFMNTVSSIEKNKEKMKKAMEQYENSNGVEKIANLIVNECKKSTENDSMCS